MPKKTFKPGESGNPKGRPRGVPDSRTELRALFQPHKEELISKVIALALAGDMQAMRLVLDRLVPTMKAKDSPVTIGKLDGSLSDQGRIVLNAMSGGSITPDEAASLMQSIGVQARIIAVDELERRITAIEEKQDPQSIGKT